MMMTVNPDLLRNDIPLQIVVGTGEVRLSWEECSTTLIYTEVCSGGQGTPVRQGAILKNSQGGMGRIIGDRVSLYWDYTLKRGSLSIQIKSELPL